MPKKSHQKKIIDRCYYVVSNQSEPDIFRKPEDYEYFVGLLRRYAGGRSVKDSSGRESVDLSSQVDILAYAMVSNRYELLVFVKNSAGLSRLIRSVVAAYGNYYRIQYKTSGGMFRERYEIERIDRSLLLGITKRIHELPLRFNQNGFTSLGIYISSADTFLQINAVVDQLRTTYLDFLNT